MYHTHDGHTRYVYSRTKPAKPSLASVLVFPIFGFFFALIMAVGTLADTPKKLDQDYPKQNVYVYDNISIIEDHESLTEELKAFQDVTGICPVVYTVKDEDWESDYDDLEKYTYDLYVDEYRDEKHFVIVYSIPEDTLGDEENYQWSWEACQGDYTDDIITETFFDNFGNRLNREIGEASDPGPALETAFKYATQRADARINPQGSAKALRTVVSLMPSLFMFGIMIVIGIVMYRNYVKMKDVEYEEVPLDQEETIKGDFLSSMTLGTNANTASANTSPNKNNSALAIVAVVVLIFLAPFFFSGIAMLISGIAKAAQGDPFTLIFALIWNIIIVVIIFSIFRAITKNKKKKPAPLTAEYPQPDKGFGEPVSAAHKDKAEDRQIFSSTPSYDDTLYERTFKENDTGLFSGSSKTDYDDEDYKRMKRKGYE